MEEKYQRYLNYVNTHKEYVKKGFELLKPLLPTYLSKEEMGELEKIVLVHDDSKFRDDEKIPYSEFYHGEKNEITLKEYNKAKKLHKERNPHHPEYWVKRGEPMPKIYIVEMILDWWTFGLKENNPREIFDFYAREGDSIPLSPETSAEVEKLLSLINSVIEREWGEV